jgi:uncharacterized protein with HEPN domain
MSKRTDQDYLDDIREAIARIEQYTDGYDFGSFLEDLRTQDAVVRNLEVIGEAAKSISGSLKDRYPTMPWKDLAGVRDKLIHHYFGINYEIVWRVIREELPLVIARIEGILGSG